MKSTICKTAMALAMSLCVALTGIAFTAISTGDAEAKAQRLRAIERVAGLHERKHNRRLRKMLGVNPARVPWCGAAVAYAVRRAGGKPIKHSLSARAWASYGRKVSLRNARKGDIVVFRFKRGYHVAIFKQRKGNRVVACGGNMSNRFKCSSYRASNVRAVRR